MFRNFLVVGALAWLASCGVDGAPIPPEPDDKDEQTTSTGAASGPTVTVSGEARMGAVGRF